MNAARPPASTPPPDAAPAPLRAALANRTIQIMLATLVTFAAGTATALALQSGAASGAGGMSRGEIEQIVREYILENPEILPQAMERLEAKRSGDAIAQNRAAIETPFAGAWEGAAAGDVVLVEFFDYACGYCRAALPDLARLLAEDKKLRVVYRELPILSEESGEAAKVSLLAAEKGRYAAFHQALYAGGRITRESIMTAAAKVGIDQTSAMAALANPAYAREIEKNTRLAQSLRASGTPTFVIGNQMFAGAVGYEALKAAIAQARAGKK